MAQRDGDSSGCRFELHSMGALTVRPQQAV
jgi:hypothetical protein